MSVKVLEIPRFFSRLDPIDPDKIRRAIGDSEVITPTYFRTGWYYDRKKKLAWYELVHESITYAWKNTNTSYFIYKLQLLNQRRLSSREREAIITLIHIGNCPDSLREQLYWDNNLLMLRRVKTDMNRRMLTYRREQHAQNNPL